LYRIVPSRHLFLDFTSLFGVEESTRETKSGGEFGWGGTSVKR